MGQTASLWGGNSVSSNGPVLQEQIDPCARFQSRVHCEWHQEAIHAQAAYQGPPDFDSLLAPPILPEQSLVVDENISVHPLLHDVHLTKGLHMQNDTEEEWKGYVADYKQLFERLPPDYLTKDFLTRFGDAVTEAPFPLLTKTRVIGDDKAILLPINYERHFGLAFQRVINRTSTDDFPFLDKVPKAFWRGATTGYGWDPAVPVPENHRRTLLEKWGASTDLPFDIGISAYVQEVQDGTPQRRHWARYYRTPKYFSDQLHFRYLLAVEGNDVASGLKWMLASKSAVMMVPPRRETWALESHLQAWVHFIPLEPDFSDLLDKIEFCESQLQVCEPISRYSTDFMRYFEDQTRSYDQGAVRLKEYLDKVHITRSKKEEPVQGEL